MDFTSNSPMSDVERVSEWAAIALRENRIDLGAALAQVALRALRAHERHLHAPIQPVAASVPAPIVDELPLLRAVPAWREALDAAAQSHGPTGNGDADVAREVEAIRAYAGPTPDQIDATTDRTAKIPTPRRCAAETPIDGVPTPCGGGAFWSELHAAWRHVDEALDQHHRVAVHL